MGLDPAARPPARNEFLALIYPDDRARYEASVVQSELGIDPAPIPRSGCGHGAQLPII